MIYLFNFKIHILPVVAPTMNFVYTPARNVKLFAEIRNIDSDIILPDIETWSPLILHMSIPI